MASKLEREGGGKALVAGQLKKYHYFFAASLSKHCSGVVWGHENDFRRGWEIIEMHNIHDTVQPPAL